MAEILLLEHPSGQPRLVEPTALSWWQCNAFPDRIEDQWESWKLPYRRWIVDSIGSATSLYEIGCGVGANLRLIQTLRPDVKLSGSDGSPEYCQIASQRLGIPIDEVAQPGPSPIGWDIVLFNYVLSYLSPAQAREVLVDVTAHKVIIVEPAPSKTHPESQSLGSVSLEDGFVCPQWRHDWPGWCWDLGWEPVGGAEISGAGRLNLGMVYALGASRS